MQEPAENRATDLVIRTKSGKGALQCCVTRSPTTTQPLLQNGEPKEADPVEIRAVNLLTAAPREQVQHADLVPARLLCCVTQLCTCVKMCGYASGWRQQHSEPSLLPIFLKGKNITQREYYQKRLFVVICSPTQILQ